MTFGAYLRDLRLKADMSQRDLAGIASVDFTYIAKIENSTMKPPSIVVLKRLAAALNADETEVLLMAGRVPTALERMMEGNELLTELLLVLSRKRLSDWRYGDLIAVASMREVESNG